jgi:hypothetical protein
VIKEEFIHVDPFIFKKNDLIYASHENKKLSMVLKCGDKTQTLAVNFSSEYECEQAMARLSVDTSSLTADHWQHSMVKQMFFTREIARNSHDLIEGIKKEIHSLRKELRRNRLVINNDSLQKM